MAARFVVPAVAEIPTIRDNIPNVEVLLDERSHPR
jgi:hypothetical protein